MKDGFVYMMASRKNGTIYIGSTSNLSKRAYEHRNGLIDGFTRDMAASCWFGSKRLMICRKRAAANCR